MKYSYLIFLMFPLISFASNWKTIAQTTNCDEKIQIMGKEGEKYVVALKGEEKIKLFSNDGSTFKSHSINSNEFTNEVEGMKYRFIRPGDVEGNPPKIDLSIDNKRKRCRMELVH